MKIETLKKLIELESERHIDINRFKDSVIQLINLYESDREIPSYPIGVPNTEPITPITPIPPPNTAPYPLFPPTYVYPNGTIPSNLYGIGSASSPSTNPIINTSNVLTSETSNTSNAKLTGEVANTSKSEFLHQIMVGGYTQ